MIFQPILIIPSGESLYVYIYIWYKVPFLDLGLIPVDKYLGKVSPNRGWNKNMFAATT